MGSDFVDLAALGITTIGTVAIAGEVVKVVRSTARQAQQQPRRRKSTPKRKFKNSNILKIKW